MTVHRWRHRIGRRWRLARGLELDNPVLVYQMGKVASTSVFHSLLGQPGINAYHVHRMNPATIAQVREGYLARGMRPIDDQMGEQLYQHLIEPQRPAQVITLIREPIGRNVSAFFEGLDEYMGVPAAHDRLSLEELTEGFFERYMHTLGVEWFDDELGPTLGINVYGTQFPQDAGHHVIRSAPYELLIMRHDLPDQIKEGLIADFVGLPEFHLARANEAANKPYADVYRAFRAQLRVPADYADTLLGAHYTEHFYSLDERTQIRARWTQI